MHHAIYTCELYYIPDKNTCVKFTASFTQVYAYFMQAIAIHMHAKVDLHQSVKVIMSWSTENLG